ADMFKKLLKQPNILQKLKRLLDEEQLDEETTNCHKRSKMIPQHDDPILINTIHSDVDEPKDHHSIEHNAITNDITETCINNDSSTTVTSINNVSDRIPCVENDQTVQTSSIFIEETNTNTNNATTTMSFSTTRNISRIKKK
ncbi:unnamed protein product, partial [Rotaria sp. Silwood1]